jgi:ABC-type uncharacterized transport system substrate-binding protein
MDHEILLHIIDGPGTGLTVMVLGFFALVGIIYSVNAARSSDFQNGKEAARREGLENLQSSIARLVHDQQEIKHRLGYGDTIVPGE